MTQWLLLNYKLPAEPSANRVYIWRKLRRLGAVFFQDSLWILPQNARNHEQFRWLAGEIAERGGEATLWEAHPAFSGKEDELSALFKDQVNESYLDLLAQLEQPEADLDAISRQYQHIQLRDHFHSEMGQKVRQALLAYRGEET